MNPTDNDLDTLARTVWGEARGEGLQGQIAVAWVIWNRSRDTRWPDTLSGVCRQRLQFSAWNENDPNAHKMAAVDLGSSSFRSCMFATLGVVDGVFPDPTKGANHYHAPSVSPRWAAQMAQTRTIGNHIFLRA